MPPPNKQIVFVYPSLTVTIDCPEGVDARDELAAHFDATNLRALKGQIRQRVTGQGWRIASLDDVPFQWHIHHFDGTDSDENDDA